MAMVSYLSISIWLLCFSLFFALFVNLISATTQSSTITYQVHSYNDLREWPQILRKGAVYFKTDPHYMPSNFCISQPQVPQNPLGCFVLSHDEPVPQRQYNSTYSILNFISDPQYASYYKNPERRIHIALCFKLDTANPCDGSATAQNWTATVDAFFEAANTVVAEKGLNVEFILDGAATPTNSNFCLVNKWRPWVATWIPGDSEAAPFSNNVTLGLDRFQVFNPNALITVPAYYIDLWELQNYGKFSQANYSYLIWEPSDQLPILDISNSYLRGPIHALGLRFAINIDPVQLQVFSGAQSGVAWNDAIASNPTAPFESPALAVVTSQSSPNDFYIISAYIDALNSNTFYSVSTAPSWSGNQLGTVVNSQIRNLSSSAPVNSLSTLSGSTVFASQLNGSYSVYAFNETEQELTSIASGELSPCTNCSSIAISVGANNDVYVVQVVNGNASCSLAIQLWQLQNYSKSSKIGAPNCVQSGVPVNFYSVGFSSVSQGQSFCSASELPGILTFSDTANNIYTSVLCLDVSTGDIEVNGGESGGIVVDVGSETSVSLNQFNGQIIVIEVHDNGFCWNSEPNNKQPTPATCSNTPTSIQYILNYNFGSFDDWATHVMNIINHKNQSYNLDSIFSSCHPTILHGAYDSGSSPSVALFSANYNSEQVLLHAEVHVGLPKSFNSTSQCGFAVPKPGAVVLDSWLLNDWIAP